MAKTQVKKKSKLKKALIIILSVIIAIAIVAVVFIEVVTIPTSPDDENAVAVGGLIVSDDVDYQYESGEGIKSNPVVKIMQMVWKFCSDGDAKKHSTQTPPDNVEKVYDIPYIDDSNIYHQLDVYYPENATEKMPVIIDIHGGGWMYGNKNLNEYYCLSLASRGYVVFNMSYRLVPDVTVNEQLQDIAMALKWIKENMANYPCDMENIMLTGDSAGGQLAVYSAVLLQSEELRQAFDVVNADMDITALLLTSPVAYMDNSSLFSIYTKVLWGKDRYEKSTADYMNLDEIIDYAQLPPTYLITSSGDTLAHTQTTQAYELLKEKGVECEIADYGKVNGKKLEHVFSVLNPFDEAGTTAIDGALEFYQKAINNK